MARDGRTGEVLSAAAGCLLQLESVRPARMDSNLSGFTDVRCLHYHGIQSDSDASEWISRGMRVRGFSGWEREVEGRGRIASRR